MANNTTYKPNEGKREEFRRYLEKTGVMDALTKALVLLYEEPDKPDDALRFIQNSLARQSGNDTIDDMKTSIGQLQERIVQLENDNRALMESGGGAMASAAAEPIKGTASAVSAPSNKDPSTMTPAEATEDA